MIIWLNYSMLLCGSTAFSLILTRTFGDISALGISSKLSNGVDFLTLYMQEHIGVSSGKELYRARLDLARCLIRLTQ